MSSLKDVSLKDGSLKDVSLKDVVVPLDKNVWWARMSIPKIET